MNTNYFECSCHSDEHRLVFRFDMEDDCFPCCAYVFLGDNPWRKRIWYGLKYIFGYKCKYGHFDEFVLDPKDAGKMIEMLEKIKEKTGNEEIQD